MIQDVDEQFFKDLFSLDREKIAMVKGFIAGLQANSGEEITSNGRNPPKANSETVN